MGRTHGRDWTKLAPAVLDWLRAEIPKRRTTDGIWVDCGAAFHIPGDDVRGRIARYHAQEWADIKATLHAGAKATKHAGGERQQEVTKTEVGAFIDVRSDGRKIKTVDDLLAYAKADLNRYEVTTSETSKYEGLARDPDDVIRIHEMFRIWVRLKLKTGKTAEDAVKGMLEGAFKERAAPLVRTVPKTAGDVWQEVDIADTHFGKYAWRGSTGAPDYDLAIARKCVGEGGAELLRHGNDLYHPTRRTIGFIGDVFHYDTPAGTTTKGTPLERDGRYQKMIEVGCDTCIALIELSAATCPTEVIVVHGNHDEILSAAFQRILVERFRRDRRVTIENTYLPRKYVAWEGNLIGFAHGEKAKKKLPQLMAIERPDLWGAAVYREIHTGHLHYQAAEWQRPIETIDGVIVRIAPSVAGPDDWHTDNGFIGAARGMETFFYRRGGGLLGMLMHSPDFAG